MYHRALAKARGVLYSRAVSRVVGGETTLREALLERAARLVPALKQRAAEAERLRRLPLLDSEPIQRLHRDAHAASHHAALTWDTWAQEFGRQALR